MRFPSLIKKNKNTKTFRISNDKYEIRYAKSLELSFLVDTEDRKHHNIQKMNGRDASSIPNVDLPSTTAGSRVAASLPCRRKSLVNGGQGDVFYGEDDVADLMFREEEVEQDSVMRAYRSDEAMRSIQDTRRRERRSFFCSECFDFLILVFSRNRN